MGGDTTKRDQSGKGMMFLLLCFACFFISAAIHYLFFENAAHWKMPGFSPESYDTVVPRTFRMKRVEIDPKTLETDAPPVKQQPRKNIPIPLEKEIPQMDKEVSEAGGKTILVQPKENTNPLERPEPVIPTAGLQNLLNKTEETTAKSDHGIISLREKNDPALGNEQAIKLPEPKENELINGLGTSVETEAKRTGTTQFSSLDDLLGEAGMVKQNTAPILMPTDLLFEYDSDMLKPAAAETLTKLGSLIKKNAQASFRIEGHTDSFGNDEYNNKLSLRRAEAVKSWLLTNMGLNTSRISTIGLGKSRLLVPATGTVDQQQLNRRVEIIITVPK